VAAAGGTLRTLSTVRRWTDPEAGPLVEIELEVEGLPDERLTEILDKLPDLRGCRKTKSLDKSSASGSSSSAAARRSPRPCLEP